MDDEETSDVDEEIYRSKDPGKKSSKSRKQSSKEPTTKKDGLVSKHATVTYVVFAVTGPDLQSRVILDKNR